MKSVHVRRLLAGCGLVTVGLLAVDPAAAVAAPAPTIRTAVPDVTVVPGPGGSTVESVLVGTGIASHPVMTFDLADLPAGVTATADGSFYFTCTTAATVITCTDDSFPLNLSDAQWSGPSLTVKAGGAAKLGATGKVHTTITADGEATYKTDSKVTVGEGVDLTAGPSQKFALPPGGTFHPGTAVRNSGSTVAHGAVVWLESEAGLTTKRYSNCLYGDPEMTICTFDEDLTPGKAYGFSPALTFQVDVNSLAPGTMAAFLEWMTPQDWTDLKATLTNLGIHVPTTAGTDGKISLTQVLAPTAAVNPPQTDTNPLDNAATYEADITGSNPADLAAVGATASATVGATVHVDLGVKNNGPATVRVTRSGEPIVVPYITIPHGTTATTVPNACAPATDDHDADWQNAGKPGAAKYLCTITDPVKAGATAPLPFTLRIDAASGATGAVTLYGPPEYGRGQKTGDTITANDTATITITTTAGGTGSGGSGGGTGGGTLPVTGTRIGLIAASGIVVLAAGLGLRMMTRRRRFVAPPDLQD